VCAPQHKKLIINVHLANWQIHLAKLLPVVEYAIILEIGKVWQKRIFIVVISLLKVE
jgi:hypothetical protein